MHTVDEKPETLHIYVVREEVPKPQLLPLFFSAVALCLLLIFCVFSSFGQPEIRKTIRIPAVFLPIQTFAATAPIIPTGSKTYPARTSQGILTITNGSVIASELPQGLIFTSSNGTQIRIDARVFVPAGSAIGYGFATVSAHALVSGKRGNLPAYALNVVAGSSIYIRNLSAFTGGADAYSVKVVTPEDRKTALNSVRTSMSALEGRVRAILAKPCKETIFFEKTAQKVALKWQCQFVTYALPSFMHVTRIRVSGKNLLLDVFYTPSFRGMIK